MLEISELIYETCKTYLVTQGKFILILELFIGAIMVVYFGFAAARSSAARRRGDHPVLQPGRHRRQLRRRLVRHPGQHLRQLPHRVRRLQGKPFPTYAIPLKAGMSIGMLLISVELVLMLGILLFVPGTTTPAPASSASPSASRSAPRRCASPAASSPRSPTSAPT